MSSQAEPVAPRSLRDCPLFRAFPFPSSVMTAAGLMTTRRRPLFGLRRRENIESDSCEDTNSRRGTTKSRSGTCSSSSDNSNSSGSSSQGSASSGSSSSPLMASCSSTSTSRLGSCAAALVVGSVLLATAAALVGRAITDQFPLLLQSPVLLDRRWKGWQSRVLTEEKDASSALPPSLAKASSGLSRISPKTERGNNPSNRTANIGSDPSPPQYYIIVDGGSTGSRLHVFHFARNADEEWECQRLGSARAGVPLTDFAVWGQDTVNNVPAVADHLLPAFREAAMWIPLEHRCSTRVLYQATAGMRLLPSDVQQRTYQTLYDQLLLAAAAPSNDFPFALQLIDIDTLSGDDEGFYGAVAANYLDGAIDANLRFRTPHRTPDTAVGALDMGGSSTQIVFLPENNNDDGSSRRNSDDISFTASNSTDEGNTLQTDGFFIHSYLSYGVDQFRLQLWDHWIDEHRRKAACAGAAIYVDDDDDDNIDQSVTPDTCEALILENPCVFRGYRIEHRGHTLLGTGRAHKCVQEVQTFLRRTTLGGNANGTAGVGGVSHPPVRGKFYAMSNYFYALDSLRHFASPVTAATEFGEEQEDEDKDPVATLDAAAALHQAWPTPTLHELTHALPLLCDRAWHDVLNHHDATPHAYTQPHLLPHRCADAAYMVALLQHGFGFDPQARSIEFALDVNGSEVEWTLGMALVLWNNDRRADRESETVPPQHCNSAANRGNNEEETCHAEPDAPPISSDGENPRPLPPDDALSRNDTAGAVARPRKRDAMITSTQTLIRHVADFIVTASSFDYMHTM